MNDTTGTRSQVNALRGMGRIFQRGQVWWVAYYHNGR